MPIATLTTSSGTATPLIPSSSGLRFQLFYLVATISNSFSASACSLTIYDGSTLLLKVNIGPTTVSISDSVAPQMLFCVDASALPYVSVADGNALNVGVNDVTSGNISLQAVYQYV